MGEWLGTRFGTAIAACGMHEAQLARQLGGENYIIAAIPNAIDLSLLDSVSAQRVDSDLPTVGICGRYSPQRRPELFRDIAQRLAGSCLPMWVGASEEELGQPGGRYSRNRLAGPRLRPGLHCWA